MAITDKLLIKLNQVPTRQAHRVRLLFQHWSITVLEYNMADKPLTGAELVILSLICEGPQHGYQIEQQISLRNMRAWTDLSTSSIYYLLGRLEDNGLIEQIPGESPASSNRPRNVYQLTQEGGSKWEEATLQALSRPKITYTNFLVGLHNLWNIKPEQALEAVIT